MISVITPAFNEEENLPTLYARLVDTMAIVGGDWEWLVVDDHSRDRTFIVIDDLAQRDTRVRGIRLARNSGSHVAITCALHHAGGDAAILLAGDLQDPPETINAMLDQWRRGANVVWAARREQPGEPLHAGFATVYYWIMRHVVGMKEMPARGADFFLVDRSVITAFKEFPERNVSVLALITWLGFRQATIEYDKQPRVAGQSGWTLARKVKLVVDSIVSFSNLPIRLCWYAGTSLLALAMLVFVGALVLLPSLGAGLMVVLAVMFGLAGLQLIAFGIIGEYVSRALDEARRRPAFVVETTVGIVSRPAPSDTR